VKWLVGALSPKEPGRRVLALSAAVSIECPHSRVVTRASEGSPMASRNGKRATGRGALLALEYEKCRTWGHAWEDFIPMGKRPANWGSRFSLRCERCHAERHDVIDGLGRLSTRHYDYPEDYRMSRDETPTREQLRLDLLKQLRGRRRLSSVG